MGLFRAATAADTGRTLPGFQRNRMFVAEMRHFLHCLDGHDLPLCSLEDGLRALHIALAARRAAEEGTVIHV